MILPEYHRVLEFYHLLAIQNRIAKKSKIIFNLAEDEKEKKDRKEEAIDLTNSPLSPTRVCVSFVFASKQKIINLNFGLDLFSRR